MPRPGPSIRLLCFALLLAACGHKPPYSRADRPSAQDLLATTQPQLPALAVSDAEVTINRIHRADLAMLAQTPNRFRGTVSKAGNELVSLSFHEDGYGLRYKLDQLPTGFYHGPPDPCAVEAMLTVPFTYEGLVALVLGGAPTLDEPYEILDQRWDRHGRYEELVIGNDRFVQELRFVWQGGQWRFTGSGMWRRTSKGERGQQLWDLLHDRFGPVGSAVLPGRTRITAPGKRGNSFVKIVYSGRDPDPPWAEPQTPTDSSDETDGKDPDPWKDDEGGWEDGEDEWEDGAVPAEPTAEEPDADADAPSRVLAQPAAAAPDTTPDTTVPATFVLNGAGLTDRGDLCR